MLDVSLNDLSPFPQPFPTRSCLGCHSEQTLCPLAVQTPSPNLIVGANCAFVCVMRGGGEGGVCVLGEGVYKSVLCLTVVLC